MPDARERTKVQRRPRDHSSHRGGPRRGAPDALGARLPKRALESVELAGSRFGWGGCWKEVLFWHSKEFKLSTF